ncbi:MAG: lipoyl(octanoyl) transferase LipB [Hyphomicrobiales bacterium]|nr:lipoyl(octanoyl) transferase LipB [Hyphomicrobiales bacterium]
MNVRRSIEFKPVAGSAPVQWCVSEGLVAYEPALAAMERRAEAISQGRAPECLWALQHPAMFTAGTSARPQDLLDAEFPVHVAGRGGQYTYHGPGQRVVYVMLDLNRRRRDLRAFVCALESWVIAALAQFDIAGETRSGRVGVWVPRPDKPAAPDGSPAEDKIAAIGIRVRRWVSFHGLAVNVEPNLTHYRGIVPCGISEQHLGVTSLDDLARARGTAAPGMGACDIALQQTFREIFGSLDLQSPETRGLV